MLPRLGLYGLERFFRIFPPHRHRYLLAPCRGTGNGFTQAMALYGPFLFFFAVTPMDRFALVISTYRVWSAFHRRRKGLDRFQIINRSRNNRHPVLYIPFTTIHRGFRLYGRAAFLRNPVSDLSAAGAHHHAVHGALYISLRKHTAQGK